MALHNEVSASDTPFTGAKMYIITKAGPNGSGYTSGGGDGGQGAGCSGAPCVSDGYRRAGGAALEGSLGAQGKKRTREDEGGKHGKRAKGEKGERECKQRAAFSVGDRVKAKFQGTRHARTWLAGCLLAGLLAS